MAGWGPRRRMAAFPVIAFVVALLAATTPASTVDAGSIVAAVDRERASRRLPPVERPQELQRAAQERAQDIADLPAGRRLSPPVDLKRFLLGRGISRFSISREQLLTLKGYSDPAAQALKSWRRSGEAWAAATGRPAVQLGLGWATASDDSLVFVAILLEPPRRYSGSEMDRLERGTFDAINRVRVQHGLSPLTWNARLAGVARAHSEDMARRNYFAHEDPDGLGPAKRVENAGLDYHEVAENLAMNRGANDPVATAVDGWMHSPGHRENILTPEYRETGIGISIDDDGQLLFTQLFYTP